MKQDIKIQDKFNIQGVMFDSYHTYRDFNLYIEEKTITPPTPKTNYVTIPYGDGDIDLTEALGEVKYNNRTLNFKCFTIISNSKFEQYKNNLVNKIHGKNFKIVLDVDSGYYYKGRVTITEASCKGQYASIVISCNVEPYKLKNKITEIEYFITKNDIEKAKNIILKNSRKSVIPTIITDKDIIIRYNNKDISLQAGEHRILEVLLVQGDNIIKIAGDKARVIIRYQEADL